VVYYVIGDEVVGFTTVGFKNVHIYLKYAMNELFFPSAVHLRSGQVNFKHIVSEVIRHSPNIKSERQLAEETPSMINAEFDEEIERAEDFEAQLK